MENIDKIKRFLIKNLKWIVLFITVILFLAIAEDVIDKDIAKTDTIIYNAISKNLMSNATTVIAKFITNFGGSIWLILMTIFLFILIKNKKIGISISLNLAISALINYSIKQILRRPRPTEYRFINESGYSFPSGHSMVSMAFYGFLIYLLYKHVKNNYVKWTMIFLISMLIISIGFSRIYLGVHYASDVIGGFILALSYLIVYINLINEVIFKENN